MASACHFGSTGPRDAAVITIASSKGGVGKSTVCLCLAGALLKRGERVHIVDLDENQTVGRWHRQHQVAIAGLSVAMVAPAELSEHLKAERRTGAVDVVLVDVAGVYEQAMLLAMGRADLVIVPAQPSEPDIHEATKVVRVLHDLAGAFNATIPYRLLLNLSEPLAPLYQRHAEAEVTRLGLRRFATLMHRRAAYREAFMNGLLPHYADASREAVAKATAEIDDVLAEIDGVLAAAVRMTETA